MKITEVRIVKGTGKVLGYVSVVFDNCFVVTGIRIIVGNIVAMPDRLKSIKCCEMSQRTKTCVKCGTALPFEFKDICHPIDNDFRLYLNKTILEAYENENVPVQQ